MTASCRSTTACASRPPRKRPAYRWRPGSCPAAATAAPTSSTGSSTSSARPASSTPTCVRPAAANQCCRRQSKVACLLPRPTALSRGGEARRSLRRERDRLAARGALIRRQHDRQRGATILAGHRWLRPGQHCPSKVIKEQGARIAWLCQRELVPLARSQRRQVHLRGAGVRLFDVDAQAAAGELELARAAVGPAHRRLAAARRVVRRNDRANGAIRVAQQVGAHVFYLTPAGEIDPFGSHALDL